MNIASINNLPDFSNHGYEVTEQLGWNRCGGRVTYKAVNRRTRQPVAIKQFRFLTGGDWSGYQEVEREIEVLRKLNHPGIPRYLDKFDPGNGVCLVQEYKNAQSLSIPHSFDSEQIKNIAVEILRILVYLQQQIPPVIHRDIKPENILIDNQFNVYLVDFGLAQFGEGSVSMSGTPIFLSPEQCDNQKLTKASDLYSLGVTIVCLVTNMKSTQIGELKNYNTNRIKFKSQIPGLNRQFNQWLKKMIEPDPKKRFRDAETALKALQKPHLPKNRRQMFAVGAAGVIIASCGFAYYLKQRIILDDIADLEKNQRYEECIKVANKHKFFVAARNALNNCEKQLNKTLINEAQEALSAGKWQKAKEKAEKVTSEYWQQEAAPIIQKAETELQAQSALASAKEKAMSGDLLKAISNAQEVLQGTSVYSEAQKLIAEWKKPIKIPGGPWSSEDMYGLRLVINKIEKNPDGKLTFYMELYNETENIKKFNYFPRVIDNLRNVYQGGDITGGDYKRQALIPPSNIEENLYPQGPTTIEFTLNSKIDPNASTIKLGFVLRGYSQETFSMGIIKIK